MIYQQRNRIQRALDSDITAHVKQVSDESLEQLIDSVQDLIRHENFRATHSSNIDLVATQIENGWLDIDYDLAEVLDYLSVDNDEFLEELQKGSDEGWFDAEKLNEVRETLDL